MTSGHVLFSEQLSTVFHVLFSLVLSFSLFLGTSQLWMGWQRSCSSSFHSFKTCWLVTMAVFPLSQLSSFIELWHCAIIITIIYFLHLYMNFTQPYSRHTVWFLNHHIATLQSCAPDWRFSIINTTSHNITCPHSSLLWRLNKSLQTWKYVVWRIF